MIKSEKLYTFTVEDSNNFSTEDLKNFAYELCLDRAPFHGWAPDFTIEIDGEPVVQDKNKLIYTFNLFGNYIEGASPIEGNEIQFQNSTDKYVASPVLN